MLRKHTALSIVTALLALAPTAHAADTISNTNIGMELARDLASAAVLACRADGYQVSAVVVDRNAIVRAELRDDLAPRFTLDIAERKANLSIMGGADSGSVVKNRADLRMELDNIDGLIMMQGGVLVESNGQRIGAIGVSGAPGGDKDEVCAKKALQSLQERIEFGA